MARILVAGGGGYIGSRLCPELLRLGHEVDVVDLFWFGCHLPVPAAHSFGILANEKTEIGLRKLNIFDLKEEGLRGYDQVIFLAGLSNDPMAEFSPSKNFIYNAAAPAYLAYIAKRAGVRRFVYASSCSVYGRAQDICDESSPTKCSYPYGMSKLQGEHAVLQMQDANFSVIALRKGTVSGYSPRMRFDLLVNTMYRSVLRDGAIRVADPDVARPVLGIADAIQAYVRAVFSDANGVFNVASENRTVMEVAEAVRDHFGSSVKIEVANVRDLRHYRVSFARAAACLGFCPRQGLAEILNDLSKNMIYFKNRLDAPECFNIRVFKELSI